MSGAEVRLLTQLVPGPASEGAGVEPLAANNNLDAISWRDRLWLAWRTAPTHFASRRARIEVVSAPDLGGPWRHETTFALGADVRECRFVIWEERLHLYVLELGTNPLAFEPRATHLLIHDGSRFGRPTTVWESATVPWRFRVIGGRLTAFVYTGADRLYAPNPSATTVEAWTSEDGVDWQHEPGPIHIGGTEFDAAELDDGSILGLTRLEGPRQWGSAILRGHLGADDWREAPDPRKFDSPCVFRVGDRVLLVARRQLRGDGSFDLGWRRFPPAVRTRAYQARYSLSPKRSALWEIDPERLDVCWLADLPSRGDTSFGTVVPRADGSLVVVDYTSPLDGPDVPWIRGQLRPTVIVASDVQLGR